MLLLKTAAVNGEIFSLRQTKATYLVDESSRYSIKILLRELENRDLVELIFDDGDDEGFYRFNHPFLRETLYSLLLF